MTRDAKLFILFNLHWKVFANQIQKEYGDRAEHDLAIFKTTPVKEQNEYAVLSVSDKLDEIITRCGGSFTDRNVIMGVLKKDPDHYEHLYGNKNLISYLTNIFNNDLDLIHWTNFSIQQIPEGWVLCVVCMNKSESEMLFKFLSNNLFKIRYAIHPATQFWALDIHFDGLTQVLWLNTHETLISYPKLSLLRDGSTKWISAAYQTGITKEGIPSFQSVGLRSLQTVQPLN